MCTINDDSRFYEDSAALVGTTEVAITVELNLQGIQGHQSQAVFCVAWNIKVKRYRWILRSAWRGRGRVSPQTRRNYGKCGNRQTMNKSNTEVILSPRWDTAKQAMKRQLVQKGACKMEEHTRMVNAVGMKKHWRWHNWKGAWKGWPIWQHRA